ncbi:MAG TPA: response regulator transcription factor [Gemmatimonadales bacterium]|nr:response regulator transcription factor [Gemmatimonadales bacterium]
MTAAPARIRILIADDHTIVREGIRQVFRQEEGFDIVAEAANGNEALAMAVAERPDVAVLDITMPGMTGLQVAQAIRDDLPDVRVVMLSMHDNPEYVLEAVRAGAHAYLLKDLAADELRTAVAAVHAGESYYSQRIAGMLTAAVRDELAEAQRTHALHALTPRERDVLQGIVRGETNKEIAARFGISHRTVETHRESLMRKLRIRTVAGLTRFALEAGLDSTA